MISLLVSLAILVAVCQLTIGPIMVFLTHRYRANPAFSIFDPQQPPLPLPATYFQSIEEFTRLGFGLVAHVKSENQIPGTQSFLTIFRNTTDLTSGNVTYIATGNLLRMSYIEFCTEYSDGREVLTNNVSTPKIFAYSPEKVDYRLPHLERAADLYRAHVLFSQAVQSERRLPEREDEIAHLAQSIRRDLEQQVRAGYYFLDKRNESFRPTVKGAILMTWRLAWPIGTIRKVMQRWTAKRLTEQLGL